MVGESTFEPSISQALVETLRDAQRLGFFGGRPIELMIGHALQYLPPLAVLQDGDVVCDLGSGGGLPGLVIAERRPDLTVVLVDRRQKRTDFLHRAERRLRLKNVRVVNSDVDAVVTDVDRKTIPPFDGVTARGFGPPELFLRSASGLLRSGGIAVISEPPAGDRWLADQVAEHDLAIGPHFTADGASTGLVGGVQTFVKR